MDIITARGLRFVDAQGRERIFHGLNLKTSHGCGSLALLDEAFFCRARALGQNCLRLGVHWEMLEPEPGQYNEDALRQIDAVFALAEQYGVYIFLDMHQDLYGGFGIGNGGGAPLWATVADGHKRGKTRIVWSEGYYLSRAVHRAFTHFWNNDPVCGRGLQEHFAALWQMLARRYADHPALLGYDLFNEPFPGDGGKVFRKLIFKAVRAAAFSPAVHRVRFIKAFCNKETRPHAFFDALTPELFHKVTKAGWKSLDRFYREKYTPFVQRVTNAIREVTPKGIIIIEHSYWSNIGIPFSGAVPVDPVGQSEATVYSPHSYDLLVDTPAYRYASNARLAFFFDEARRAQERLQIPVLVGEWGGGGEGESFFPHIRFLLDYFDGFLWSNAYFTYTDGLFAQPIMRLLSRPYPVAVNGELLRIQYDDAAARLQIIFTQGQGIDASIPTELYLPRTAKTIEAPGFLWEQEELAGGGVRLLLTGGGAGEHTVTVVL
ncbi:MAG: cellulase family glycosylhydrolase [Oscillospiraceae bacterium]|jgi:endoglycosylceramidase|nr:cellulase family glycosylhydrolase [Oscillospiraceae bacterium]